MNILVPKSLFPCMIIFSWNIFRRKITENLFLGILEALDIVWNIYIYSKAKW